VIALLSYYSKAIRLLPSTLAPPPPPPLGATPGPGEAVQVDPAFSQLTPRLLSALETTCDKLLSSFAFKCNLRHYSLGLLLLFPSPPRQLWVRGRSM